MTRLFNDPVDFADELVEGFVAANGHYVTWVPGGVVRRRKAAPGTVAVVVGGGSGHYPAFAGLVGRGLAHGAAMGNLFASPSTQQVRSVATRADAGGGILFTYGNYAGDVLNFDAAQEELRADGVDVRTVLVTDDISSAPAAEKHKRRGIAGDLVVFKVAGAAAEEGATLDEVERVAQHANERTRTLGVAFSGCTLPGATEPLFTVPEGRMAVGMGIHGEPGIEEVDVPTADGLAGLFVDSLLADLPDGVTDPRGARVVPILNGLGSVKYEELFVVYRSVARRLDEAGITAVGPQVGEFCTSFDMAGASLTLLWLDDELERLWSAPADAPAFRQGAFGEAGNLPDDDAPDETVADAAALPPASEASRAAVPSLLRALEAARSVIAEHADELGRIDAVAGDGDHGIGMLRGVTAAVDAARQAAEAGAGSGTVLIRAGDAWGDRAGGTSGALWCAALRALGRSLGDDEAPDAAGIVAGVEAASAAITSSGKAEVGDKTMVDAIVPFVDALRADHDAGRATAEAWASAAGASTRAAAATADLLPRKGRARPHAQKSLGTPDPGAHSFALIVMAIGAAWDTPSEGEGSQ